MRARLRTELLVVGGGPAGMACLIKARALGLSVVLVDEQPKLGGQYYRDFPHGYQVTSRAAHGRRYARGRAMADVAHASGATVLPDTTVYAVGSSWAALAGGAHGPGRVVFDKVILATGAYDRPVPFPGWTLPGVVTAGCAQGLIKTQRIAPGRRIIMAGSGPVTLAFSAQMSRQGANLTGVFEAAPPIGPRAIARYASALRGNSRLLGEGLASIAYLRYRSIPLTFSHRVVRAEGDQQLEHVIVARVDRCWQPIPGTERAVAADTLCLGYGFLSSNELARAAGCEHGYVEQSGGLQPTRDQWLRTSVETVLVAGDGAEVRGVATAVAEGALAAVTAAWDLGKLGPEEAAAQAGPIRRRLRRLARLQQANMAIFPVGSALYQLATPDTIVCRCEDVTAGEITRHRSFESGDVNVAKARTRAGMGRCQGRHCQWQISALLQPASGPGGTALGAFTSRHPVKPVRIGSIVMGPSWEEQ
jgi:D-hydroxyproline dehydrogenase subunit alpha